MYHLNNIDKKITRLEDLRSVKVNETAIFIINKMFIERWTTAQISDHFQVPKVQIEEDVEDLLEGLRVEGFEMLEGNILDVSCKRLDLSAIWTPTTPIIHIIQNCNSPCIMCDCWKTRETVRHGKDVLFPFFDELEARGVKSVMISGGEPLMHPELKEIIENVKSRGMRIELNTNGFLLHKNTWILDSDVDEIVISIDAPEKNEYHRVRGANKLDLVLDNIRLFKSTSPGQSIGMRATVTNAILGDLHASLSAFSSFGVDFIGFSPLDVSSVSFSRNDNTNVRAKHLEDELLPDRQSLEVLKKELQNENGKLSKLITEMCNQGKISWSAFNFIKCIDYYLSDDDPYLQSEELCNFPYSSLVLDYNGDVRNCFYSKPFGNIYNVTDIDWSGTESISDLKSSGACVGCRGKIFCG